nr:alpha/beta hydrolase [Desulfobacula sp.]
MKPSLKKNAPPDLLSESKTILDQLRQGKTTEKISPSLMALFRPSVQPYLISWFVYSPEQELSQISVPSLIVQGTTDIQVSASDAERLLKSNKLAQPLILSGMNHVLKIVPDNIELQIKSYGDPNLPVPQELIDKIAVFIKGL